MCRDCDTLKHTIKYWVDKYQELEQQLERYQELIDKIKQFNLSGNSSLIHPIHTIIKELEEGK